MRFRSYDALRVFDVVARRLSFTAAAIDLNLTKGAVGHRINRLEDDLGFAVFRRGPRGLSLTEKGERLWRVSRSAFADVERTVDDLRAAVRDTVTLGLPTYFASRWLSSRLMHYTATHPQVRLRLVPMTDVIDLRGEAVDMAVRWGTGAWSDLMIEPLLACPVFPTAGRSVAARLNGGPLETAPEPIVLLHDRDGSPAWSDWHAAAGVSYRGARDALVIPDPNVRVQAVVDGQGVALNDRLAEPELSSGTLVRVSTVELEDYGYHLAYPPGTMSDPVLRGFRDWLIEEAAHTQFG